MEDRDHGGPAENLPESPHPDVDGDGDDEGEEEDGGAFTFPLPPFLADACIVPVYPIFGRAPSPPPAASSEEPETATVRVPLGRLLLEEREFRARQGDGDRSPSDEESCGGDGELEGVAPESYCLWAPGQSTPASPLRCRKSGSTGSVLRWRRMSERLVGRSHSDGKDKFLFLNAAGTGPPNPKQSDVEEGGASVDAHGWSYYSKGGGGGSGGAGPGRRRSYLPYKQELVGLFANVSGLRRSYPPF